MLRVANTPAVETGDAVAVDASAVETTTKKAAKAKAPVVKKPLAKEATPKAIVAKGKKTAKQSPAKKNRNGNNTKDRASAKAAGLGLIHFRVLRALRDSTALTTALTYRGVEKKTGYYAPLAEVMHTERGGESSLCALGLARRGTVDEGGRNKVAFIITARGRKLLEKVSKGKVSKGK